MEDKGSKVIRKIREGCTICGGRGFILEDDDEMSECVCVLRSKVCGYLSPLGKISTNKALKRLIDTNITDLKDCKFMLPLINESTLRGFIAQLLMRVWKHLKIPPTYRVLEINEVAELWLCKREKDLGSSLFDALGAKVLILTWNGVVVPNKYLFQIARVMIQNRCSKGWFTWILCPGLNSLPEELGDDFLEALGFSIYRWGDPRKSSKNGKKGH